MQRRKERFPEVDALRGCAIVMMLIYHTLFDLVLFGNLKMNLFSLFWRGYVITGASLFVGIAGLSLTLRFNREKAGYSASLFLKYLKRGCLLLVYGAAITIVTYLVFPKAYIRFGVLHCLGVSTILAYPLIPRPRLSFFLGLGCIILGNALSSRSFSFSSLFWLGFKPRNFLTLDYFPLLPWFGVVLLGISLGNFLYPLGKRRFPFSEKPYPLLQGLAFLGRHSLTIYLLHQPVIIALLLSLGLIHFPP